jgi:hypothetical protein
MAGTLASVGSGAATGAAIGSIIPGWGTAVGAGVGALAGLVKGIVGGVQASRGKKQLNTLLENRPQYNISQGYLDAYKTYQGMANSNLPGYDIMKGQIDQSGARTMQNLERGAMSSNQLMSGALSSQDKELDAYKNLGLMSAQWKSQQQQQLAGAQQMMGGLQDTQWQQNVNEPWNIKANMANERIQAGMGNMYGGAQDIGSSLMNYAGTSSYMKMLQGMQKQGITQPTPSGGGLFNPDTRTNINPVRLV